MNLVKGPWQAQSALRHGTNGDGVVVLTDNRNGHTFTGTVYRFPIGWRCHAIDTWPVPAYAKQLARKAMNSMP